MEEYGLIGKTLGHSFSGKYFSEKFQKMGIEATYGLFELDEIASFPSLIASKPELKGLNVTIPYKQAVIPYLSGLSKEAEIIGAVNTIVFTEDENGGRQAIGHNTDALGFKQSLDQILSDRKPEKALVLGTGGAAHAVGYALCEMGIIPTFVSRTPGKGYGEEKTIGYDDLGADVIESHLLVVNATPLGTFPDSDQLPPIPYQLLTSRHIAFDLVYNPPETAFMKEFIKKGSRVTNGWDMLKNQAELSWELWQHNS